MTLPRFLQTEQEQAQEKAKTEAKQKPVAKPDFGGTLTLSGIKKKKK